MTGVQDGTPRNEAAGVPPWAAELLRLYDSCNAALGQLDALSQRQRSLIDMEDPEPLLALMTQRQHTAEALARDAAAAGKIRAAHAADERRLPAEMRRLLEQRAGGLAGVAQSVMQRDEEDRRLMETRSAAIRQEMNTLGHGRRAVGGYATNAPRSARLHDGEA